ncbi:ATP-binding response regulator [Candidatus Chloroploca asiatica]|uniref:Histidine kinase n=1 Tax=Candidatus Chloroploca asiatica TaxID=1506545 RepID=A0A2H3L8D4_9CHLR|nr:response regulator [Candidatus Chloroploca asiatica]PDV99565.1 hypothetical protein A9Q02_11495 [Candidatus Chloroploca asiatica]
MTSILIVEDELLVAMDTKALLTNHGYNVAGVVTSGGEAVKQALNLRPDLVLMDIRLRGEIDGVTAATQILSHLSVPVIYVTAFADEATLLRARTTAPYGYLVKPFDESTLIASITMAVERHFRDSRATSRAELLSTILNGSGDAVLAVDANGLVTYVNDHAARILHQDPQQVIGRPVASVVPLRDPFTGTLVAPPALDTLLGAAASPRPRTLDLCIPGHAIRSVMVGAAPANDTSGVTGAVMILWEQPAGTNRTPQFTPIAPAITPEATPPPQPGPRPLSPATQVSHLSAACASLIAPGHVDRLLKLHLLLVLQQHPQLHHDALSLSEWLKEPPWDVQEALTELTEIGLLAHNGESSTPAYRLIAGNDQSGVAALARAFDDPELRQLLVTRVRAAQQERLMRQPPPWDFLR